jgi:hypothetical protein
METEHITNAQIREAVEAETRHKLAYITCSALLKRGGWTRELIQEILDPPDLRRRGSSGCGAKLYSALRVEVAEKYLAAREWADPSILPGLDLIDCGDHSISDQPVSLEHVSNSKNEYYGLRAPNLDGKLNGYYD